MITEFPRALGEQLQLISSHGVLIAPHGAGLMNAMFAVPGSAIVEIFPYHLDHNLYSTVAMTSGIGYFPVHTYNGSDMWARDKVRRMHCVDLPESLFKLASLCHFCLQLNFELGCENLTVLESNYVDGKCRDPCIHYRMHVGVHDFEVALRNAIHHVERSIQREARRTAKLKRL